MYNIWNNFRIPIINTIPDDPYLYIAIPFRQYNDSSRSEECVNAKKIHESIKQHNVKIDPLMHIAAQDFHIIDFNRNMHSIVSREFGNQFLDVMAYPRFLNKIKQNHKLWQIQNT